MVGVFQNFNANSVVYRMNILLTPIINNELERLLIIESLILKFNIDISRKFQFGEGLILKSGDGSTFNLLNGHMRLSKSFVLSSLLRNISFFFASLFLLLLPRKNIHQRRINLFYGFEKRLIQSKSSLENITKNLSNDNFDLTEENDYSIFENRHGWLINRKCKVFCVAFDSGLFLVRSLNNFRSRLKLVFSILLSSISKIRRYRSFILLSGDRLLVSIPVWLSVFSMNRDRKDIQLITTQSNLSKLPAPFFLQTYNRTAIWYSNNSLPFKKAGEMTPEYVKVLTSQFIDKHFVWSQSHADFLKLLYPDSKIIPVGPIVFDSKISDSLKHSNISNRIMYFDVTPFENLDFTSYYSEKICLDTLNDISEVSRALDAELSIKPKRSYLTKKSAKYRHSMKYLELLRHLESLNLLKRIKFDESVYNLISDCRVVIGVPYTSPVLVAKICGIDSIYYIPEDTEDWVFPALRDGIHVIRGKDKLLEYLQEIFVC